MVRLSKDIKFVDNQELFSTMPLWDYRDYARGCSGCYDARRVLKMAVHGSSLSIYDCQCRSRDTLVGTFARRWRAMTRSRPCVFMNLLDLDMPLICPVTEIEYVLRVHEMLPTDILSN